MSEEQNIKSKNVLMRQEMRLRRHLYYEITVCDCGAIGQSASERL